MSLFGSLQVASNTLQAMQVGLQVVGNNIANANTEGFIREQVNFAPAPPYQKGNLTIGLGVKIDSITQVLDTYLGEQLRGANRDLAGAQLQDAAYKSLEGLLGELTDTDLSTGLNSFFNSIQDSLDATSDDAYGVVLEGKTLARDLQRLDERAQQLQVGYDDQIVRAADEINRYAREIQDLNLRITQIEGGGASKSEAGALRTQRRLSVDRLTELVGADVIEQDSGGLSISIGGEFIIFEGQRREIVAAESGEAGSNTSVLLFADTSKKLDLGGGLIDGLTTARDQIVGDFRDDIDALAENLIFEFNKVYSSGQGLTGFESLTSKESIANANVPLDQAGLAFTPQNGEFNLTTVNKNTGIEETTRIKIQLLGADDDTTFNDLAAQIDAIDGLSAIVDSTGRLKISTDTNDSQFYFSGDETGAGDTSNILASLGLNTFFTGNDAGSISVNNELDDISKFAASQFGLGAGSDNSTALANLIDKPLEANNGASLLDQYQQIVTELAQNSTVSGSVRAGLGVFAETLNAQFQAASGVNIDEEAINMISLQRVFQATGRYIQVIQEMLDTLLEL